MEYSQMSLNGPGKLKYEGFCENIMAFVCCVSKTDLCVLETKVLKMTLT